MTLDINNRPLHLFFCSLAVYFFAIVLNGYCFGTSDQIELLPILQKYLNPELYPHDFYVSFYFSKELTERTPLILFLKLFGKNFEWTFFLFHFFSSTLLISGLIKLSIELIRDQWLSILATAIIILLSHQISLGDNELYYNIFVSSLPAKGLGIWAIYLALKERWPIAYILLAIAGFLQPLVALQLFIIASIAGAIQNWKSLRKILLSSLIFIIPFLLFFIPLLQSQGTDLLNPEKYFEIIEFRLAHHFIPSYFRSFDFIISVLLFGAGIFFFLKRRHKFILGVILSIALGTSIYLLGLEQQWPLALNTQWFKTTIYIEAMGIIGLLGLLKTLVAKKVDSKLISAIGIILICVILLLNVKHKDHQLPFLNYVDEEKEIALKAKSISGVNDIFLIPPAFSGFKYYSQRSSPIDFKAMIHHHDYLSEYYQRVKRIYQVDIQDRKKGRLVSKLKENYLALNKSSISEFCPECEFIVTYTEHDLDLPKVTETSAYTIYQTKND